MTTFVYIAKSLDGYIARADGDIDWLTATPNPTNDDFGFSKFLDAIDAIIMGRNTFNTVLQIGSWPYPKPVFVLSNSLQVLPKKLRSKAEIVTGSPLFVLNALRRKGYKNFYIDGGKTIRSFLDEDLIDEMIITTLPILLGKGIPLFTDSPLELQFKHLHTEILMNSYVKSHYQRVQR